VKALFSAWPEHDHAREYDALAGALVSARPLTIPS
jgi:hypothetical protein